MRWENKTRTALRSRLWRIDSTSPQMQAAIQHMVCWAPEHFGSDYIWIV